MTTATAQINPNLAFINYWGNRDKALALTGSRAAGLDLNEAEMAELKKSAAGVAEQTEKVKYNY
jgi:mevalonate pyrophosphate decarboxylase